jgi:hypothetical protein
MADTPLTFAEYAKSTPDVLSKACINTLIADDELLSVIPMSLWQGGKSYTWVLNNSGPTIAAIDETTVLYSSKPTRHTVTAYLTQYGGEVEIPVFLDSSMAMNVAGWTEDVADLIRAFGQWLRSKIIVGDYMTEANATVIPFNSSAKPGIDAITTLSANMGVGEIWFKYVHVGTLLSMKAPGSSTYGTAQAVADGAMTFADGDDTTKTVTVTIDASDYTDLAENTTRPGITTVRPESIAGLRYLATLDSAQTWAPSTDGDAITLAALDKLDEMCLGPRNEKIFLMNARTRRAVNTLQRAAGAATVQDFKAGTLPNAVRHNGIPLVACPGVSVAETQGATITCGRVYCVRLNSEVGWKLIYGAQNGPNFGQLGAATDDDVNRNMSLPLYVRRLGERENYATWKVRATGAFASVLMRSKSCSMMYGVTS